MGLDVYLNDGDERIEEPSNKYPDHLCNKGYLRSSYNPGGFNHYVGNLIGKELYWVFGDILNEDEYELHPNLVQLAAARNRAQQIVSELRQALPLSVVTIAADRSGRSGQPRSEREAQSLEIYREEVRQHNEAFDKHPEAKSYDYSNAHGHFWFTEPLEVLAAIPGIDILGQPAVHLITKSDDENHEFYVQMADIVVEFLDRAIACDDPIIHWSS